MELLALVLVVPPILVLRRLELVESQL